MSRARTPEQKAAWAEYMRQYRRRQADGEVDPRGTAPTARQIEILRAYADPAHGGSQTAVAESLGISVSAVNNAIQRLMKRLDVRDPAQAVYKLWIEGAVNGPTENLPDTGRREAPSES